jgi:hypothetical protein
MMDAPILHEAPRDLRGELLTYAMSGLNMLAGTLLARQLLSPQTLLAALLLIVIGVPCSLYFRRFYQLRILLNLIVMGPLLYLTWALVHDLPGLQLDWQNPLESIATHATADLLVGILHIFVIIAAGRAFLLVSMRDLTQSPLPSLFIFLLVAIAPPGMRPNGSDPLILLCLLVLACTSLYLFCLVHCQLWFTRQTPVVVQRKLACWVIIVSTLLFFAAVPVGLSLRSFNLYTMERLFPHHYRHSFHLPDWFGGRTGITYDQHIEMGGDRWLTGNQVVMTVIMDQPTDLLWRAASYNTYQYGEWSSSLPSRPVVVPFVFALPKDYLTIPPNAPASDPGIVEALREGKISLADNSPNLTTQGFEINAYAFGNKLPLYGAYQIYQISAGPSTYRMVSVAADGGVTVPSWSSTPTNMAEYTITSIIKPSPMALHLVVDPPLDPLLRDSSLEVPAEIAEPIRNKAQEILTGLRLTPRSKPLLIVNGFENYLRQHYLYTLQPSPPKGGVDPILDFLLTQKQGYCNYFSGALVMLCRSVHIPARFVVGFATGERIEEATRAGKVAYRVTANDAHSWVEVYLPHYGWYTSDPTNGSKQVTTIWSRSWDAISSAFTNIISTVQKWSSAVQQDARVRAIASLCIAGVLALAALLMIWRRERPPTQPRQALTTAEARRTILQCYARLQRWLELWGITKPQGITAREFARLIRLLNAAMGETVDELSALYLRARYSDLPLDDQDARRAIALLQQLWVQWKVERKHLDLDALAARMERADTSPMH